MDFIREQTGRLVSESTVYRTFKDFESTCAEAAVRPDGGEAGCERPGAVKEEEDNVLEARAAVVEAGAAACAVPPPPPMPQARATLYYYNACGRGNQLRLALAEAGLEWQDEYPAVGYPPSEEEVAYWRSIGGNLTTNVPMLKTPEGKVLCQSSAILRAIGRMNGGKLMPSAEDELYLVDKLIADAEDARCAAYKALPMFGAGKEAQESFVAALIDKHLPNLERQLGDKDFFVGDMLTVADITVFDAVTSFGEGLVPHALAAFPRLRAWKDRVAARPRIAAFLSSEGYLKLRKFPPLPDI